MERALQWVRVYDSTIGQFFNKLPRSLYRAMIVISLFGQPPFTVGIVFLIGLWGWDVGNHRLLVASLLAMLGIMISSLIKFITERARPKSRYVDSMWFDTYSFPSGHASGSTIAYGLLTLTLVPSFSGLYIVALIVGFILASFLIGISRIYLEAHYPSDVTAGWLLGLITIGICQFALTHQI